MNRLRGWRKMIVGAAMLLALPASTIATPAAAEAPASEPRPAIWLLADDDTKIYLFGTLHMIPRSLVWRSQRLERVIEEADELVMELDEREAQAAIPEVYGRMILGKNVPLVERVSPQRRQVLRRLMTRMGLPIDGLDGLQTWAAAMALAVPEAARRSGRNGGLEDWSGVEEVLDAEFLRRERPVSGIETPAQQLGFFSGLPQSVQRALLEQTIDAIASGAMPTDPEDSDWVSGNVEAIAREMEILPPEVFTALLTNRNRAWTRWLVERLDRPGTILFAVGAGHLAGRDSVQSMLEARGLRVTRID